MLTFKIAVIFASCDAMGHKVYTGERVVYEVNGDSFSDASERLRHMLIGRDYITWGTVEDGDSDSEIAHQMVNNRIAHDKARRIVADFTRRNHAEYNAANAAMTPELAATARIVSIFHAVNTEETYNYAVGRLLDWMSKIGREYYDAKNSISTNDPAFYAAYGEVLRQCLNEYIVPQFN